MSNEEKIAALAGYKIAVTNSEKYGDIANDKTVLKVDYSIMDSNDQLVDVFSQSFDLDTPVDTIKAELVKALSLYVDEAKNAIINAEANAVQVEADATIEALKGLEIAQVESNA